MKKIISILIITCLVLTVFPASVFASSYSSNYSQFKKNHSNGDYYTPENYSKTKTPNELFVEEFYENVFFSINLKSLRPIDEIETRSTTAELKDFFDNLYAGDIIRIEDTYSIFLYTTKNGVQLYDVDNPMNDGKTSIIHESNYSFTSLKEYSDIILAYQPNPKDYDMLGNGSSNENYTDWYTSQSIKDATIKLNEKTETSVPVYYFEKGQATTEITNNFTYTSSNKSVAVYQNGKIITYSPGIAYISAQSKDNNYDIPPRLKVQVSTANDSVTHQMYWDIKGLSGDTLYLSPGEDVKVAIMQKRGGTYMDFTNDLQLKTSNSSIAYIKNNTLYAIKDGEVMLSAYSQYDDITPPPSIVVKVDGNLGFSSDSDAPRWSMPGLSGTTLSLEVRKDTGFSLYIVKNSKKVDVTDEFNYSVRNNSVAYIQDNRIYAGEPGTTTLTATPKNSKYHSPETISIIISEKSSTDNGGNTSSDADRRPISNSSYYTYWRDINVVDNQLTMYVGDKLNPSVYLQDGNATKDVTNQININTSDRSVVYIKNSTMLVAASAGTVTISGKTKDNFAPNPPDITITVLKRTQNYSDNDTPIWTMDGLDGEKLSINISNYISRYISTGIAGATGINDTTSYMTFDTKDHDVAVVSKDGTIKPISVGTTILYADSKYASQFIPEPLIIEIYENKGEDGEIYFAIDGKKPIVLRLQEKEEVPFQILLTNKDGTVEDLTEEMFKNIEITGSAIYLEDGNIVGKKNGEARLDIDITGHNFTPYSLDVQVRPLNDTQLQKKSLFKDVTEQHWAYKYIMELAKKGIINGFDDETFKPEENITLEQAVKMIVLAKGENQSNGLPAYGNSNVSLNNISPWAETYVQQGMPFMNANGAFKNGFYGTDQALRIEILNLLEYTSDVPYPNESFDMNNFKDFKDIPSWGFTSVELFASHGILQGDNNGFVNPNEKITRAEMSKLLWMTFFDNNRSTPNNSQNNNSNSSSSSSNSQYSDFCSIPGACGI